MKIHIEDLKFKTIIGILNFERETPQDVIINLEIEYEYIDEFINYADIVKLITKTMKKDKFLLLEDALKTISVKLKKEFSQIETINLKITKPSIIADCKVSLSDIYKFNS